ncbi:MAG: sigma 54-interacting transcriptional regulator [Bacteroidales bacterium OttesenSCG-928-I14]|jgi:Nif-specific regulatory protein|nr:sigma 54-interacting transcriptional regulator [Bacteroidales bacterium OttesenSCG-928-I14]
MICNKSKKKCYTEANLAFLSDTSIILNKKLSSKDILERVLKSLCEFLNAYVGMITLNDRFSNVIMTSISYELVARKKINTIYQQLDKCIISRVAATRKPEIILDITKTPFFLDETDFVTVKNPIAFLCVPVINKNEVAGTLSVYLLNDKITDFSYEIKFLKLIGTIVGEHVSIHRQDIEKLKKLQWRNQHSKSFKKSFYPENMVGNSTLMCELYELINRVAPTNTTVMIRGESGVGKELIAEAIHKASFRNNQPFVRVNCSALPENLIESELFGHEKGAFTGADKQHIGRFELANKGTIFLDEIADLPFSIQVKLLRVLQQRQFERVGGTRTIKINVRIITATNRNLEKMVKDNTFREDLYYRILVFPIYVPALRERSADIIILTEHFIQKINKQNQTNIKQITNAALNMLMVYSWPGNVRELENIIERAMILTTDNIIHSYNLPPSLQTMITDTVKESRLTSVLCKVEKQMIIDSLSINRGNISKSSFQLGITERVMGLRIKKYNIDIRNYK